MQKAFGISTLVPSQEIYSHKLNMPLPCHNCYRTVPFLNESTACLFLFLSKADQVQYIICIFPSLKDDLGMPRATQNQ